MTTSHGWILPLMAQVAQMNSSLLGIAVAILLIQMSAYSYLFYLVRKSSDQFAQANSDYKDFVKMQGVGQRSFLMAVAFVLPLGISVVSVLASTFGASKPPLPVAGFASAAWGVAVASFVLMITLELSYLYDIFQRPSSANGGGTPGHNRMAPWLAPLLMTLVFDFLSYLAFVLVLKDPKDGPALQTVWLVVMMSITWLMCFLTSFECLFAVRTSRNYLDSKSLGNIVGAAPPAQPGAAQG